LIGQEFGEPTNKKLKLFFLSVLWRASISTHDYYKRIDAGPHANVLRDMILSENPGCPDNYSVVLAKFDDPLAIQMLDPHKDRFDGLNFYRFYLTGFVSYIKVDSRKIKDFMNFFILKEGEPLCVLLRNIDKSKDGKIMKAIISNAISKHRS
jgi:hypothetical protein